MLLQEWSEQFLFPHLPRVRIVLGASRMLWAAPEPLPSLTTFIYPHGGIGALANTFRPLDKVVGDQPRELQQASCFRVTQNSLEPLGFYASLQLIFVNTDDTAHPRISLSRHGRWMFDAL